MIRTSQTHPLRIDAVQIPGGQGLVGITFCPGKQQQEAMTGIWERDLETDLKCIIDWGASALVTLIEQHELESLGVADMPARVKAMGLEWYFLPIKDYHIPSSSFEAKWSTAGPSLRERLLAGKKIVVHCKGGLGRAGTIAAQLLVELGMTPDSAIAAVREERKGAIETSEQEDYVRRCQSCQPLQR